MSKELSEDRPIAEFTEDRLGYSAFCRSVAKGLTSDTSSSCLVVSLNASWGMGKTSAVNLIKAAIRKEEQKLPESERTIIVDFNPWLFSGRDDLVLRFFEQLGACLPKDLREKVFSYGKNLKRGVNRYGQSVGTALDASGLSHGLGSVSGKVATIFSSEKSKSLAHEYGVLSKKLHEAKRRILVVLDDVDRLLPYEMREVLVMLRSTADLPGIIYLVVCDRDIVDQGLKTAGVEADRDSGKPTFLEKIIQVDLHLPEPVPNGLDSMFNDGLSELIGDSVQAGGERALRIYREGIRTYLNSPRSVVRLLNALKISWPPVAGEVNLVDFLAIEALRVFDRSAYEAIKRNRYQLVGYSMFSKEERDKWRSEFLTSVAGTDKSDRRHVLLIALFPCLSENGATTRDGDGDRLERRISNDDFWDAYFRLEPNADVGSAVFGQQVVSKLDDQSFIEAAVDQALALKDSQNRSLAGALLDDINDHIRVKRRSSNELIRALLSKADFLMSQEDKRGHFIELQHDNRRVLGWIFENTLDLMNPSEQAALLNEVYSQPKSAAFLTQEWWRLAIRSGLFADADASALRDVPMIDREVIGQLAQNVLRGLETSASDGTLKACYAPIWTLKVWQQVSNEGHVREWLEKALCDPRFVVRLCDELLITSYSNNGVRRFVRLSEGKSPFTDMVHGAARRLERSALDDDEISVLTLFLDSYDQGSEALKLQRATQSEAAVSE